MASDSSQSKCERGWRGFACLVVISFSSKSIFVRYFIFLREDHILCLADLPTTICQREHLHPLQLHGYMVRSQYSGKTGRAVCYKVRHACGYTPKPLAQSNHLMD